ncbi:MAG: hypothetical protein PHS32_16135 [Rhodoferax sp.]|uniref:hypothetical protein n=1 Tax=Rhodoferax sp. TaxID=50421 RepID=UPI00262CDD66|nr:hypothetical protein [Rhodoferax sp.]MDD5335261.1 hypothetical protein [Rhodoferax sp.]
MTLLPSDLTSLIWGVALGVIGAFGTGFLKKAGEECYSWIRKKFGPKIPEQAIAQPQVVIQVTRNDTVTATTEPTLNDLKPVSIERVSGITFDEIREAISKAPPLQQELVEKSYVGLRVEWDTYFKSGSRRENDLIMLLLTTDNVVGSNTIWCEVPFNEYRELGVLPRGARIRVAGEVTSASQFDVKLKDARLYIYGK